MSTTATERARASAWQSWETWCRLNGYEPFGIRTGLSEYLLWLVDPYGGALSAASANLAYWAVRSELLKAGWRDPARDQMVLSALAEIGRSPKFTKSVTLYEDEEPLAAMKAWRGVRRRRDDEPVFASIPWTDKRVSSIALTTSDVGRIVTKRALEAGLGKANGMSLARAK